MAWSCFWWPIYAIQICEYVVWTFVNKYILTLLEHHRADLVSGIITAAALSSFLSWFGQALQASVELSLVYLGLLSYAGGHAFCGIFFYTHWVQRPIAIPRDRIRFNVLSVAGYTGVALGLYVFSFFLAFPWQATSSSLWSLIVFPCFLVGVVSEHSGTPTIRPMVRPFNTHDQEQESVRRLQSVRNETEAVQLNREPADMDLEPI